MEIGKTGRKGHLRGDAKGSRFLFPWAMSCIIALISGFSLLFTACDEENSIFRDYACYFVFDTTLHPAPCQLTTILGNPGHFAIVKTSMKSGIRHLQTTRNYDHAVEDVALTTKRESETRCLLGANNAIIIGRSSYTNLFVCYEGQCPNCLNNFSGTNFPLTWNSNGQQLTCARCHRTYDPNNGIATSGEGGHPLYTYNIALENGILRAWN